MKEYNGALQAADHAAVFYSKHALELKRMPDLPKETVKEGFGKKGLSVFNERSELENWLNDLDFDNAVVAFMSSGNYDGIDTEAFANRIIQTAD